MSTSSAPWLQVSSSRRSLLLPFAALSAPDHVPSAVSLGAVAALGVACTALALYLYFYLINVAGAARASVVAYINPAVAAVIGVLVLQRTVRPGDRRGDGDDPVRLVARDREEQGVTP